MAAITKVPTMVSGSKMLGDNNALKSFKNLSTLCDHSSANGVGRKPLVFISNNRSSKVSRNFLKFHLLLVALALTD